MSTPPPRRGACKSAGADLVRIGESLSAYLAGLLPTLIHVLAHPGLGRERLLEAHRRLAFHPLLGALSERLRSLTADKLVREVDPARAAEAFMAVVHSATLFDVMARGTAPQGGGGRVAVLLDVHGHREGAHTGERDLRGLLREAGFTQIEAEEMRLPWVPAHPRLLEIVSGVKA